jgi:transposase
MHTDEYQWMKKYPSTVYQSAFIDLKEAFSRWRKGLSGFPRKKSKKKGDSFTVYKTSGVYPVKGKSALPFYRIRIEDLNISGMVANHKLAEAVSNNCFHEIRRQLTYKQAMFGTLLEVVSSWYPSSKTCSQCGHIQTMPLSERVFNCGGCGQIISRDLNASLNLEHAPDHLVRSA